MAISSRPSVVVGPDLDWTGPRDIATLFAGWVHCQPQATALTDGVQSVSYADLDRWSAQIADDLVASGARTGCSVAVCMPRGLASVAAMLALVRLRMPYVPLDPEDPLARLKALMETSRVQMLLVDSRSSLGPAETGKPILKVPGFGTFGGDHPKPRAVSAHPDPIEGDAVYILFTSGTTGDPKGVVVGEAALSNRLLWMRTEYAITPADRILVKTPYTFDVSGWEIWLPLISGGCAVILAPGAHRDPGAIARTICDQRVTICHFVPSMLRIFLAEPAVMACSTLRTVFASGEALPPTLIKRFRAALHAQLHNLYGPTEAAIDVSFWDCAELTDDGPTLIGSPIASCLLAVVDDDLNPVPVGKVGQLVIGGVPLAWGYVGNPTLTASAFVPAPNWSGGRRLYLTGDRARLHDDGFEYLGRGDSQVKIRGQRVELEAVEDAVRSLPGVRDVAAVCLNAESGGELAVVVVVDGDGRDDKLHELRKALAATSAASHIPTRWVTAPTLPTTRNGKRDQSACAQLVLDASTASTGADAVSRLWPGPADLGFLSAGGHSLLAAAIVAEVRAQGASLTVTEVIAGNPTLDQVRQLIVNRRSERDVRTDDDLLASPAQHGLWTWRMLFPDCPAYNVTVAFDCPGGVDRDRLQAAVDRLVAGHEELRSSFCDGSDGLSIEPHDARVLVEELADTDAANGLLDRPFHPSQPLRFALGVASSGDGASVVDTVYLSVDHLVSDQRSIEVLLHELSEQYAGRQPAPAAVVLTRQVGSRQIENDLAYWRTVLSPAPTPINLPFASPRPELPSYRGAACTASLSATTVAALASECAIAGGTVFCALLAVFAWRLGIWTDSTDVVIGVPMSGRETKAELSAVGLFVNTLPVRLTVTEPGPGAVAAAATALFTAGSHASVSFEDLVAALGTRRGLDRNPVFQVWCNDVSRAELPTRLGETAVQPHPLPTRWSLFDLGLYLEEDSVANAHRLRLVFSADLWSADVAQEMLNQCVADLKSLAGELAADGTPTSVPNGAPGLLEPVDKRSASDRDDGLSFTGPGAEVAAVLKCATLHPQRTAIQSGTSTLTYGELASSLQHVADQLQIAGCQVGDLVAVRARRDAKFAAEILGCWRAGAVPMLLDETDIAGSLQEICQASGARFMLGDEHLEPINSSVRPHPPVGHVLLTSATSGTAQLVGLPPGSLDRPLRGYAQQLGLGSDDVFAFTSAPGHDPVFRDLLLPLQLGARVELPTTNDLRPDRLARWLRATNASILHLTPSQGALLAGSSVELLPSLRHVVFHGEPLTYGVLARWRRRAPTAQLWNLYGTTETPQASSLRCVPADETGPDAQLVPLGPAAPGRRLVLAGPASITDQVGAVAEIIVAGDGLFVGYLGDGREAPAPDSRGYRTGDLGRLRPDGLIDYLGRRDRQVSVAGHRLQLEAVEHAVQAQPGVTWCHARAERGRVVAEWTGADDVRDDALMATLRRLPDYMVPADLIRVARPGLSVRGKAVEARPATAKDEGEIVARLLTAVCRFTGRHEIAADDNWFDIGLTSLSLLQLLEELRPHFPATRVTDLFRFPTVAQLAAQLARAEKHDRKTLSGTTARRGRSEVERDRRRALRASFTDNAEGG